MRDPGIEQLREILEDDRLHLAIAQILDLEMNDDRSLLMVNVNVFPENIEMVAKMSWEAVGPDAGDFQFPSKNDMVIVGFIDGHEDDAFIIRRLTSKEDKIPIQAVTGDKVSRSLAGKRNHLLSDTELLLGRGGADPTEQLVLGNVFQTAYSSHLAELSKQADTSSKHTHIGNLGYYTASPDLASDFSAVKSAVDAIKASPVDDLEILSDLSKTEK